MRGLTLSILFLSLVVLRYVNPASAQESFQKEAGVNVCATVLACHFITGKVLKAFVAPGTDCYENVYKPLCAEVRKAKYKEKRDRFSKHKRR